MTDSGATGWLLASAALVMLMTPALGYFYGGLVRKKNLANTVMLCFATLAVISLQWVLWGYSLSFGPSVNGFIGGLNRLGFIGVGTEPNPSYSSAIPHLAFAIFQAMFAVITPALIIGSIVERVRFGPALLFIVLWATFVYNPVAHWVWAVGGWLREFGVLDFQAAQ